MKESAELISLAAYHDVWPRVLLQVVLVLGNFFVERLSTLANLYDLVTQLQDGKEVPFISQLLLLGDALF